MLYNANKHIKEYMKKKIPVDSMLSKPEAGWTIFRLGDTEYKLSYLQDIPCLWLDAMIYGNRTEMPYVVFGECEPGFMYCVVIGCDIHIFYEDRYKASYVLDRNFAEIIMNDISRDLDAWAEWTCSCGRGSREDIPEIKIQLQSKMNTLRALFEEKKKKTRERIQEAIACGANIVVTDESIMDNKLKEEYYNYRKKKGY